MKRSMAVLSMLSMAQNAVDDLCLISVAVTMGFDQATNGHDLIDCLYSYVF